MASKNFNRRRFLSLAALLPGGVALLTACNGLGDALNNNNTSAPAAVPTSATNDGQAVAQPAAPKSKPAIDLPNKGPAPDFNNKLWLNTEPLSLATLRGKVFMVEFWTFECINCQHVTPSLRQVYADYKDKGFTIVSFHDPEFETEKKWENVQAAVKQAQIEYPVAQDNDFATWTKYRVNAWPTWFLVDKQGNIRYQHIGEGAYDEMRLGIEALLAE